MKRRDFTIVAIGAALTPTEEHAQERGRTYRLGCFVQAPRNAAHWVAFFDTLRESGFVESVNLLVIDGFDTPVDRVELIAQTVVNARPDVIMTAGVFTSTVQRGTKTIPILTVSDDLLAERAVASLNHPGGNTTGISILASELDGKRQEILLEVVPHARRLALLADPAVTRPSQLKRLEDAATAYGITVSTHLAARADDIGPAMDAALAKGAQALNVLASSLLNRYRLQIIERAATARLPTIYQWPEMAEEGGLIAYGPRFVAIYRQHALQAIKVLRGTNPADIPVEQPTEFEFVVNLRTAKALGLTIPPMLLARADKVIE
jgi:putative ABC transport system substrate-binding protein